MNRDYEPQRISQISNEDVGFFLLPANGGGSLVARDQVIGARPNGNEGAIVYTEAGPSIYTTMTTQDLAKVLGARAL